MAWVGISPISPCGDPAYVCVLFFFDLPSHRKEQTYMSNGHDITDAERSALETCSTLQFAPPVFLRLMPIVPRTNSTTDQGKKTEGSTQNTSCRTAAHRWKCSIVPPGRYYDFRVQQVLYGTQKHNFPAGHWEAPGAITGQGAGICTQKCTLKAPREWALLDGARSWCRLCAIQAPGHDAVAETAPFKPAIWFHP